MEPWHNLVPATDHNYYHTDPATNLQTPLQDEDWNGRWQAANSMRENSDKERLLKASALVAVNRDFVTAATRW